MCTVAAKEQKKNAKLCLVASGAGPHEGKGQSQEHSEVRQKKDWGVLTSPHWQRLQG